MRHLIAAVLLLLLACGSDGPTDQENCHASYPDFCIPPPPPDKNCADFTQAKPFKVVHTVANPDPHQLDRDKDGLACESGE